jgi:MerR family transcriptional regulator/heat shock protein HspR
MPRRPVAGGGLVMIRVAAKQAGLHPQTVRVYEQIGLLIPKRSQGGTRLYSEADIDRLSRIAVMTNELGMNLAGVQALLELEARLARAEAQLEQQRRQSLRREAQLEGEIGRLVGMFQRTFGQLPPGLHRNSSD